MDAISGAVKTQEQYKDTREIKNNTQTLGKDAFMKLLVAQMQNQDPLNPMSNTDSIAQLAQFSSLEQMTTLNESFNSLSTNQKIANISAGAQFLGKEVEGSAGDDQIQGKVVGASFKDGNPILRVDLGDGSYKSIAMQDITSVK
ncbi:flagellar hook capping FlgD N-terminal domain-containing protein [Haliovirga abyssi]|uniref:Flagellar hook capping protein n=1 Tax=Haliovirga abyssi TaxID=2996794 RepID=A0AAU9DD64_9FUSO|nr:flagellar hook capping FlgD N-terminal domain-containing protein [Haliovirga abyssi]BDU50108.1 hypothetical protein HLVA_06770 [Haliovirga abyssi]